MVNSLSKNGKNGKLSECESTFNNLDIVLLKNFNLPTNIKLALNLKSISKSIRT